LIRVQEQSECLPRLCCSPNHGVVLQFSALDPSGTEMFPVITMEREGCCSKLCLGNAVCCDLCANEAFVHAGSVLMTAEHPPGKLPKHNVIGRCKVPVPFGGGLTPTIQVMDRTATSDTHWANATGPTCFGGCSELCCSVPFAVHRVANGNGKVGLDLLSVATISKIKPITLGAMARELLSDSDIYELEIHDPTITPQQRATLIGTALLMDYMFFEKDMDCLKCDSQGNIVFNLFNMFCCGVLWPCTMSIPTRG